jgi:hypothetical protein
MAAHTRFDVLFDPEIKDVVQVMFAKKVENNG